MVPIAFQYLDPLLQGNYTIKIGVYLPFWVYSVHWQTNLYWFAVVAKNQNWDLFATRSFNGLLPPFFFVGPTLFVVFALYRVKWKVDVGQVRGLILL